jgi:hypothetical protein
MTISPDKNDASGADSRIKGNLSPKLKQQLETGIYGIMARSDIYGASIGKRVVVTEASIVPKAEEASRTEARVVCEVTVEEGSVTIPARRSEAFAYSHSALKFRHAQPRRKVAWCVRCLPNRQVRIVQCRLRRWTYEGNVYSCSTLVFVASGRSGGVTQSLDLVFHAPAAP